MTADISSNVKTAELYISDTVRCMAALHGDRQVYHSECTNWRPGRADRRQQRWQLCAKQAAFNAFWRWQASCLSSSCWRRQADTIELVDTLGRVQDSSSLKLLVDDTVLLSVRCNSGSRLLSLCMHTHQLAVTEYTLSYNRTAPSAIPNS